jgi:hypothetical protein
LIWKLKKISGSAEILRAYPHRNLTGNPNLRILPVNFDWYTFITTLPSLSRRKIYPKSAGWLCKNSLNMLNARDELFFILHPMGASFGWLKCRLKADLQKFKSCNLRIWVYPKSVGRRPGRDIGTQAKLETPK